MKPCEVRRVHWEGGGDHSGLWHHQPQDAHDKPGERVEDAMHGCSVGRWISQGGPNHVVRPPGVSSYSIMTVTCRPYVSGQISEERYHMHGIEHPELLTGHGEQVSSYDTSYIAFAFYSGPSHIRTPWDQG